MRTIGLAYLLLIGLVACARRGSKELYYQGVDAEELAMTQKSCTDHGGTWSK